MKIKVESKVKILSDMLTKFFGDKMNLARINFFGLFISSLCKVQTVIAYGLDTTLGFVKIFESLYRETDNV